MVAVTSAALHSWSGEVGFEPERSNRYAYFLAATGTIENRAASVIAQATTYTGIQVDTFKYGTAAAQTYGATACGAVSTAGVVSPPAGPPKFTATAQGNIDADATVDQWSISSDSRVFSGGGNCTADTNNPSGEPANDQNDVNL